MQSLARLFLTFAPSAALNPPSPVAHHHCSVVSWNLLSPHFAEIQRAKNCFTWIEEEHLAWPVRQAKIIEHLAELDADILCLQEVDRELWPALLQHLEELGYEGQLKDSSNKMSLAILARRGMLTIVKTLSRSGAMVSVLRDAKNESAVPLYVGNCHLKAGPESKNAARRISQFRALMQSTVPASIHTALVLVGDFNSGRSSDIYRFLETGTAKPSTRTPGRAQVQQLEKLSKLTAQPPLPLRDAYFESPPPWGPALRRTCMSGLVDFVWTSAAVEVLRTMPVSTQSRQLPSPTMPSDHIPIGALLSWAGAPHPRDANSCQRPPWQNLDINNVQQPPGGE